MLIKETFQRRSWTGFRAGALLAVLVAGAVQSGFAETPGAAAFDSPEKAIQALYTAVNNDDGAAITRLVGPLSSSNDMVQDKADREVFTRKFTEMHRLVKGPDGTTVLYIGAENWPFPLPLISEHGKWRFDQDAGAQEIAFRRIGEAEMTAIETCRALVHPGNPTENTAINGYVRKVAGAAPPPSESFHGYYFRIVQARNGTVVIAYPAEYGATGIMTFAVTPSGTVYEKDLGPKTVSLAKAMLKYKPDRTWHTAE
jgi:hypothetical protein